MKTAGEIWQENDRDVLIRSERGTKNGAASGSGKKEKNKRLNNRKNSEVKAKKNRKFVFIISVTFISRLTPELCGEW